MARVLVVDDEHAYCSLMAGHLQRKGFEVEKASEGTSALAVFREGGPFDVLVTDLAMPGMSGIELLREAKSVDPWVEVIVITALDDLDTAIEVMREDGAYDYLIKPLGAIGELSMSVGRAAQHRALRIEREQLNQQLAREAFRLKTLVDTAEDPILLADAQGIISVANPAMEGVIGRQDLVGMPALEVLPEAFRNSVQNWQEMDSQESAMVEVEWPEGSTQLLSLASTSEDQEQGRGWVMVIREITHLRDLDELKMRMLTEAAGKIRIPLAQATSSLAELGEGVDAQDSNVSATVYQLAKLLGKIQAWMDELIALVRIEAGIGFRESEMDLNALLNPELAARFEETYQDRAVRIDVSLEPGLPCVHVDSILMERMMRGLIDRAALRSQPGGLVRVSARENRGQIWIEVKDDGISRQATRMENGRAAEDAFAVDGFGLEMVKAIVNGMGGQVWFKGQGRIGSTIAISLPSGECG
jgi:PAS domain S-box-containing protein